MSALIFKYRGLIASAFGVLALMFPVLTNQGNKECFLCLILLSTGILLRIWARMFIGNHSRANVLDAPELIAGGPYKWMRHPLYISNFIIGISLVAWWNTSLFFIAVWALFWGVFYGYLALQESVFLQNKFGVAWKERVGVIKPTRTFSQAFKADFWTWFWLILIMLLMYLLKVAVNYDLIA